MENVIYTYICTHMYIIKNESCHIHMYITRKNDNDILPFTITLTDLEHIMLSEISQTEKGKSCMI